MCPKTSFSAFIQSVWAFFKKKLKNHFRYPIFQRKGYIYFCGPTHHSFKNDHYLQKLIFEVILENIVFFEKIIKRKIFKTSFFTKKAIYIFVDKRPLPFKTSLKFSYKFLKNFNNFKNFSKSPTPTKFSFNHSEIYLKFLIFLQKF